MFFLATFFLQHTAENRNYEYSGEREKIIMIYRLLNGLNAVLVDVDCVCLSVHTSSKNDLYF